MDSQGIGCVLASVSSNAAYCAADAACDLEESFRGRIVTINIGRASLASTMLTLSVRSAMEILSGGTEGSSESACSGHDGARVASDAGLIKVQLALLSSARAWKTGRRKQKLPFTKSSAKIVFGAGC